jgi:hypothetical protein
MAGGARTSRNKHRDWISNVGVGCRFGTQTRYLVYKYPFLSVVVLGVLVVTWRVLMRLAHGSSTLYFIDISTTVLVL